jgi:hypothetical protein
MAHHFHQQMMLLAYSPFPLALGLYLLHFHHPLSLHYYQKLMEHFESLLRRHHKI